MNFYKHTKQTILMYWWMFIYSYKLGVTGFRIKVKHNFKTGTPFIMQYKYLLRFLAKQIAITRVQHGEKDVLNITSLKWPSIRENIKSRYPPLAVDMLEHLFYKLQFNKSYILEYIRTEDYYKKLYKEKLIELESI